MDKRFEELKKEQSNISRHLNVLKRSGIIEFRAEGVRSFYKIKHSINLFHPPGGTKLVSKMLKK